MNLTDEQLEEKIKAQKDCALIDPSPERTRLIEMLEDLLVAQQREQAVEG